MAPVLRKEKMLDATTTKYDEIISSILRLAPEKWVEATKAAIDVEKDLDLEGGKQLFAQIVATVENEEEAKTHTASILRKDPELSPHTFPFIIFRQARLADLFLKNVSNPIHRSLVHSMIPSSLRCTHGSVLPLKTKLIT
jgi:hypothetical protein